MMMALLLLGLGLLLIFLEFYFPGMVIGAGGVIMIVASLIVFADHAGSAALVFAYILIVILLIVLLIYLTLRHIRHTAKRGTIYLESDQEGYTASQFDLSLVGSEGVAATDLKPSGHVMVAGRQQQAVAEAGYLVRGTRIVVMGGRGAYLIVKPVNKDLTS